MIIRGFITILDWSYVFKTLAHASKNVCAMKTHQYSFLMYNRRTYYICCHRGCLTLNQKKNNPILPKGPKMLNQKYVFTNHFFLYSMVKSNSCIFRYNFESNEIGNPYYYYIITDGQINNTAWWIAT